MDKKIREQYYSITGTKVQNVLNIYYHYNQSVKVQVKPNIKLIESKYPTQRLIIDLMDFCTQTDGEYKWILQMKDHYSRYINQSEESEEEFREIY